MKKRMGKKLILVLFAAVLSAGAVRAQAPDTVTCEQLDKPFGTNDYAVFNKIIRDIKKSDAPKDCNFSVEVVVDANGIIRIVEYTGSCKLINTEPLRSMYLACYTSPRAKAKPVYARIRLESKFDHIGVPSTIFPNVDDIGLFIPPNPTNHKLVMLTVGFPSEAREKLASKLSPDHDKFAHEVRTITYLLVDTLGKPINVFYERSRTSRIYAEYIATILKDQLIFEPATQNGIKINSWIGIPYTFKYLGTSFGR